MWIEEYLYRVATDDGKGKSYLMSEALFLFLIQFNSLHLP